MTGRRPVLQDPARHVRELLSRRPQPRLIIGLAGLPGAGKSTLGKQLEQEVNRRAGSPVMQTLGMDGFHLTRAVLAGFPDPTLALRRRGAPWTFDPAGLASRIRQLRDAGRGLAPSAFAWPGFEHGVGDPVPDAILVEPQIRVVLIEGLYLLHQGDGWNLDGLLDECWYLDVDIDTAMERLAARHTMAWSLSRAQALERIAVNDRLNALTVLAGEPRADWRIR